jgi:PAS domain S-box-containing protein
MEAAQDAHWDWIVGTDEYYTSPRVVDVFGLPPGTTFTSRQDYLAKTPLLKEDLQAWLGAAKALFAGTGSRLSMELRAMVHGEIHWIQHNGVCLRDASGRAVRWCGSVRDVTERRRTEEALRLSEERYARALKASEDGIWEWSPASDRMFLSPRARELFGVPDGVQIDTRARLRAQVRFLPEDRQRTEQTIQASLARRAGGFDMEYRVMDAAGELRWLRSRAKVFPDAQGAPALVTGSLTDVTKRKRAEEALRESEKRYERVMLAAEAGFWDWYLPTDAFYLSPKLLEMGGFAPGTTFADRATFMEQAPFHPDDRVKWQRAARELFAGSGSRLAMELRVLIGGETRWHNLNGICFRDADGKVVRWTGSSTDITERKRAEEALRISEERYELSMQAAQDGHWDWIVGTGEYYVSPRDLQLYGLPADTSFASREDYLAK